MLPLPQLPFNRGYDKMLKVKKFLFCIELDMGVTIIGYIGIIFSLIMAIVFLLASAFSFSEVLVFIQESLRQPNEKLPGLRKKRWVNEKFVTISTLIPFRNIFDLCVGDMRPSSKCLHLYKNYSSSSWGEF